MSLPQDQEYGLTLCGLRSPAGHHEGMYLQSERGCSRGPMQDSVDTMSTPPLTVSLLQLMCFVRVAEAGSFAEAGRRLGMTTSGVSKAISRLETHHRVRLLHRSTHSLSLTEEGEQVLREARDLLSGSERLASILSQAADQGRAGRVRISAPPGFVRACLVPVLPRLLEAHPEIQVEVLASYDVIDFADNGVDLALRTGTGDGFPGHISQALFASPWCAYATAGYLARRGTPSTPNDLARHDLIGFRNSGDGRVGAWQFQNPGVEGDRGMVRFEAAARITFDDGGAAYAMASEGHGVVWAPEWLAINDLRSGRMIEVLASWRSSEMLLSIARPVHRLMPERVRAVINFLRDAANLWQLNAPQRSSPTRD